MLLQSGAHTELGIFCSSHHPTRKKAGGQKGVRRRTADFNLVMFDFFAMREKTDATSHQVVDFFFKVDIFNYLHSDVPASALWVLTVP